jgi:hypothetical protein
MRWDRTRSDWLGDRPFTGPAFNPSTCERIVIHYIGTERAPLNFQAWMLNTHMATMSRTPPYAFMYNAAVDLAGLLWQGRGVDLRNAANKETNATTYSIVVATNGQTEANGLQVEAIRRAVADVRGFTRKNLGIVGHRDVASTSCPGAGVYHQLKSGLFDRSGNVTRIAGKNRYETAALVSQARFPNGAEVCYVANGREFPDALVAGTLALDGPLLLTDPNTLSDGARWELARLKPKRVVIVGGISSVSDAVERDISQYVK